MTKYAACIEYNGTAYCGWQRLAHAASVQEEVEKALSFVANQTINLSCAGRTDSGVHAIGQVAHFESSANRSTTAWRMGCNANLPDDIVLRWIQPVNDSFHARFSAISRRYRYIILNHQTRPAILNNRVCWFRDSLDEKLMDSAAKRLLGENDFSSFRASACQAKHAMRELQEINVSREGKYIYIDVVANAFLHHMVRNIVGSLFEIGIGNKPVTWFDELLSIKDRTQAGITAPACGLYFVSVRYPDEYQLAEAEAPFFGL